MIVKFLIRIFILSNTLGLFSYPAYCMELDINSDNPAVTIQIFSPSDSKKKLASFITNSQYNNVHGRGKIFEIVHSNSCQKATIEKVKLFDKDLGDLGVNLNYIMVSLYSKDLEVRYNIPHIFFSGNVEIISEYAFINLSDLLEKFSLKSGTQERNPKSVSPSHTIVRKTFLKGEEPTEHAKN